METTMKRVISILLAVIFSLFVALAWAVDFSDTNPLENLPMASGWTCTTFVSGSDVWMATFQNGQARFDLRIGTGGVISELRDNQNNNVPLLAASFQGEVTDRVIQWSWWDTYPGGVYNRIDELQQFEWQWNLTQGGTGIYQSLPSLLSPTSKVVLYPGLCRVDVWSYPQDQFHPLQQSHMGGGFSALSRYQIIGRGQIVVRHMVRVGVLTLNGNAVFNNLAYIDQWNPFRVPQFNALGIGFASDGTPTTWYSSGSTPIYPEWDVTTQTSGYGVVFKSDARTTATAVGVIFGTKQPCSYVNGICTVRGQHHLNSTHSTDYLTVLPDLYVNNYLREGYVLDKYEIIYPMNGINTTEMTDLNSYAALVPAPRIYETTTTLSPAIETLRMSLVTALNAGGQRTDHLAPLVQSPPDAPSNLKVDSGTSLSVGQ